MVNVEIRYNPFTVKTDIVLNGVKVQSPHPLSIFLEERLQLWIGEFYEKLISVCEDCEYKISFYGLRSDAYELKEALEQYLLENQGVTIHQSYQISPMDQNRLVEVKELFNKIQKESPFEELKDKQLVENFHQVMGEEFPISIIGTMSAGKSTLINSLLGTTLMPMKSKACTAIETIIKDNKRRKGFSAKVYNQSRQLMCETEDIKRKELEKFNDNPEVAVVELEGAISNIRTNGNRLCIVDTPGTNNSRNLLHKERTYEVLHHRNKPMIIYVINGKNIGVNDDKILLTDVAKAMAVKGKQTKERFIFAVTHMDDCAKTNDSVKKVLDEVKKYLAQFGINHPNIYPCTGYFAMNLRRVLNGELDIDDLSDYDFLLEEQYAFSSMARLSSANREKLHRRKEKAKEEKDELTLALLETGIPAIEMAIEEYLGKYVYMSKVKSAVDTFQKQLEIKETEAVLLEKIHENELACEKTNEAISYLGELLEEGKAKDDFRQQVQKIDLNEEIETTFTDLKQEVRTSFHDTSVYGVCVYGMEGATINQIEQQVMSMHGRIHAKVESFLEEKIQKIGQQIMDEYEKSLGKLVDEGVLGKVQMSATAVGFVRSSLPSARGMISKCQRHHRVQIGERFVRHKQGVWDTIKGHIKNFFTGDNSGLGHYEAIYRNESYTDLSMLQSEYRSEVENMLLNDLENTQKNCVKELEMYKNFYIKEMDKIDGFLIESLEKIKRLSTDKEELEKTLQRENDNRMWLKSIMNQLDDILEI